MNDRKITIKILNSEVTVSDDYMSIEDLLYLKDNPRVFSCVHEVDNFETLSPIEQQSIIQQNLLNETSVKNLRPDIISHGGLIEPILIRLDTKEVIEGNSRLAVFRDLHANPHIEGEWDLIPCHIVATLSDEQQDAYLSQIHVKGKTPWTPYGKSNFAYVRSQEGVPVNKIAQRFGVTTTEIKTRIKTVDLMKRNGDNKNHHFSYYDVLVRNRAISEAIDENSGSMELRSFLLEEIKNMDSDDENQNPFTAQDMRDKLPPILKKPKILKKYINGNQTLEDAYQFSRISDSQQKLRRANDSISDIGKKELERLDRSGLSAVKIEVRDLSKAIERIKKIVQEIEQEFQSKQ